jgi:hypothetical protein
VVLWRALNSRSRWHEAARQSNKGNLFKGGVQDRASPRGPTTLNPTEVGLESILCSSNDPSAGSPTETLLRLLLPLNDQVCLIFQPWVGVATLPGPVQKPHLAIQSVVATGGVYKGQGRNQRKLMTCAY